MPLFNANEIIGKTLITKKNIPIWKIPPIASSGYPGVKWEGIEVEKGKPVGVVYSYVGGDGINPLFWSFETPGINVGQIGAYFYVEHQEGIFDIRSLREQGVLTTKEREELEAEANKTGAEKLIEALKKGGKYILIAGSIYLAIKLYKEYKK